MPFKCARPEERAGAAASASSSAASAFYSDGQSASYTTQANTAIQRDLTRHALELLRFGTAPSTSRSSSSEHAGGADDGMWLLLDLGAGSGLSTLAANEWLLERNLLGFTMAFDISASMLSLTASGEHTSKDSNEGSKGDADALRVQRVGFYRGNAAQRFPLRRALFHAAIGISMLQWLTKEGLETCFASLHEQLIGAGPGHSRAVFQVYPSSVEYVDLMEHTAKKMGFRYAEVFVAFPHSTTAKKWYFCVDKYGDDDARALEGNKGAHSAHSLCLFGRRFHRRCAWHLLQSTKESGAVDVLRDRLGREHVKTAWHIWRKFRRSITGNVHAAVHAKAKRSLELWKSDEVIGKALQTRFLPQGSENEEGVNAVTYELLLSQTDNVVDILHTTRPRMLSWRRSSSASFDENDARLSAKRPRFLPPMPLETCMVLKYLVAYLLKNKLHKDELFVYDGKASEQKALLRSVRQGDLPAKLSSYSSRSIASIIRQLLEDSYAPLLPYESFSELQTLGEDSETSPDGGELVRGIMDSLVPERRGLLESLLLLLYKLALKGTPQPNNQAPGEIVGSILARPSEVELAETVPQRQRIGRFLLSNAPTFLRKEDENDNEGQECDKSVDNVWPESGTKKRTSLSEFKVTTSDNYATKSLEHNAHSSNPIRLRSPTIKMPRAGSAMLASARETLQRISPKRFSIRPPAFVTSETTSSRPHLSNRDELTEADILMLTRLLTVTIESPQDKRGLFAEHPSHDGELKALGQIVSSYLGKELRYLPIESFSVLAIAMSVRQRLRTRALIGGSNLELLIEKFSSESNGNDAKFTATARSIVEGLDEPRKALLHLIMTCARLSLGAGTDREAVEGNVMDCIISRSDSQDCVATEASAKALKKVQRALFTELHRLSQPAGSDRQQRDRSSLAKSAAHSNGKRRSQVLGAIYAVVWACKCLSRVRHRQLVAQTRKLNGDNIVTTSEASDQPLASSHLQKLEETTAVGLCLLMDFLLGKANEELCYQLPRFFLGNVFQLLVPFKLLCHAEMFENVGAEPELNIWRLEALVAKELSPMKKKLVESIFTHLSLLSALCDSHASMRELLQTFALVLQARLFTGKWTRTRGGSRAYAPLRAPLMLAVSNDDPPDMTANEPKSSSQQSPATTRLLQSGDASSAQDHTAGPTNGYAVDLDLTIPPATLSEFLFVRSRLLESVTTAVKLPELEAWLDTNSRNRPSLSSLAEELRQFKCASVGPEGDDVSIMQSAEIHELLWVVFTSYMDADPKSGSVGDGLRFEQLWQLCADCRLSNVAEAMAKIGKWTQGSTAEENCSLCTHSFSYSMCNRDGDEAASSA